MLESIAEGDAVEDLVVELSSLFVAEAVVVGCEVVGCISALAMTRGRDGEVRLLSCSVIVPSKSVKKIILGFALSVSGKGIVKRGATPTERKMRKSVTKSSRKMCQTILKK